MDRRASVIFCIYNIIIVTSLNIGRTASNDTYIWRVTDMLQNKDAGLLEVRKNQGSWMKICKPWTDRKVVNVACRQMGHLGAKDYNLRGVEQTGIIPQNFSCPTGNEKNITLCTFPPPSSDKCPLVDGSRSLAAEVTCESNVELSGLLNVELKDGEVHNGTLVYTHNGKKTPVCYDDPNAESVAGVVCKQMGYSNKLKVSAVASNATEFASLNCSGSEQTLDACTFKNHVSSCTKGLVVAVECKLNMTSQNFFDIRLSSPDRSPSQGTVEVWKYGYWGVICHNDWTIEDANVVCRQLGYRKATDAPKNAMYGQGTGVVFWDKVNCTGNEFSIAYCPHPTAVVSATCDSTKAAGVVCDTNNPFESRNVCDNSPSEELKPGVTFIRSPGFPDIFNYTSDAICSRDFTSSTNFTVYIQQKMFQNNHSEYMLFETSEGRVETLYGDNSTQGPIIFNTKNLTIAFRANGTAGTGKISIMVTVPKPPTATTDNTTEISGNKNNSSRFVGSPPKPDDTVVIVLSVLGSVGLVVLIGIIVLLHKKEKLPKIKLNKRKHSIGSSDKPTGGLERGGTHDNPNFQGDECEMKENDLNELSGGRTGKGGTDFITGTAFITDEPKEAETGERKPNGRIGRPASGSEVKVDIDKPAFNPYELEEQPQSIGNPYEFEGPAKGGIEPSAKEGSATADNANSQYAVVNKVRRGQKGRAFVIPNETPNPRAEPRPYVYANNLKQDIDNGNINDNPVPPVEYEDVRKPQTFVPGQSAAYADIELGAGGAPSIQEQGPPVPENKTKKDKKKKENEKDKEGDKKEAKRGEKKRGKKGDNKENKTEDKEADQKEDKKKSKGKKGDKSDGKKNAGSSDDISGQRPEGDSSADPMSGDYGTYAEVGQVTGVGRIEPVGGSQPDEADPMYDVFNRPGPNFRSGASDPTYDMI